MNIAKFVRIAFYKERLSWLLRRIKHLKSLNVFKKIEEDLQRIVNKNEFSQDFITIEKVYKLLNKTVNYFRKKALL